jgi:hypothetical protein
VALPDGLTVIAQTASDRIADFPVGSAVGFELQEKAIFVKASTP